MTLIFWTLICVNLAMLIVLVTLVIDRRMSLNMTDIGMIAAILITIVGSTTLAIFVRGEI